MSTHEIIRQEVSKDYAKAVIRAAGACCGEAPAQKGVLAKLGGYSDQQLADLPPEAVVNSFGCGNPLAFSGVQIGDTVLDLGSGAGIDVLLAARKVGPSGRVIGVDMTDEMIAKARDNIASAGLDNIEVHKGIIEALPVDSDSVDWVISNCVINLSPEKPRVFAEIARVLKPGGRMLVSDLVVESLPDWVRNSKTLYSSCISGAISESQYLEGLRSAGLADVEVRERFVYEASAIRGLVESELSGEQTLTDCLGGCSGELGTKLEEIAGKVWSAMIYARKPGE